MGSESRSYPLTDVGYLLVSDLYPVGIFTDVRSHILVETTTIVYVLFDVLNFIRSVIKISTYMGTMVMELVPSLVKVVRGFR